MIVALNDQRMLFVDEYIKLRCKNAKQAAINAGYSPKTAQSQSSQILKDSNVQEYLKQRKSEISQELKQEFIFDALEARGVMYSIMTNPEAADRDKIAVAKDFLDRAGFKPMDEVKVSGNVNNPFEGLTTEELKKMVYNE
jgi:phage terminase small subunit